MTQTSAEGLGRTATKFMNDPFSQAIVTGALTLIPVRNYPTWLRRGLIWAPTVAGGLGAVVFAANPRLQRKLSAKAAIAEQFNPATRKTLHPQEPPASIRSKAPRGTVSLIATGTAVGAGLSVVMAAGFWADDKVERGLRRLKIPFPRAVMGAATGVFTWWTLKHDHQAAGKQ